MKALTVRQPWAWAIIHAGKDIENRNWRTDRRGRIAIHAAKGMTEREYGEAIDFMFRRSIISAAIAEPPTFLGYPRGAIIGTVELINCVSRSSSKWFVGEYGLVLQNPLALPVPIPCRGALSFWEVPPEIEKMIIKVEGGE